nr:MGMT family protein [Candidatus Woesearchaeota archaeon]
SPIIPCHSIINSNVKIGGFATGIKNKIKLLESEGVKVKNNRIVDFEKLLYKFK